MNNMEGFYVSVITQDNIVYREKLQDFLAYFFKTSITYIANSGVYPNSDLESLLDLFDDLKDIFSPFEILRAYLLFHNENRACFVTPWECLLG